MHRTLIFLLILLTASCGFEPLYVKKVDKGSSLFQGEHDVSTTTQLSKIKIENISNRMGQNIRNSLIELLNPLGQPKSPEYRLRVSMVGSPRVTKMAMQRDITATRENIRYVYQYSLIGKNGETLIKGDSVAYSNYDVLSNPYSTTFARRKSDEDAAQIIANDIAMRLAAYFHGFGDFSGEKSEDFEYNKQRR